MNRDVTTDPLPQRRDADHGPLGRLKAFWHQWGTLIQGVWLIIVSAAILIVAVAFYGSQHATDQAAREACVRSRQFGPPLADAYARYRILNPAQLRAYRATLPDSCP